MYTCYTSCTANFDIPNILVILDSLPGLPTHATPDNIAVLATHSSLDTITTTISFTTPATFPTVANLIIVATLTAQPILANLLILSTNSSLYTINIIGCHLATLPALDIPNTGF